MGVWGDFMALRNSLWGDAGIFFSQDRRRTSAEGIPGTESHLSSAHGGSSWRSLSLEVISFP